MKAATLSQSTSRIPQPAPYRLEGLTKTSTSHEDRMTFRLRASPA
jgi:hypothetical protein